MKIFSDIALWWLIPWVLISVLLSIWYYRKQKQIEGAAKWKKGVLIPLRSSVLILLGILLYGILLETTESKTEKPIFITLIDNSSSMLNYSDSGTVKSNIDSFQKQLESKYGKRFDFKTYVVDGKLKDDDNYDFKGTVTNLNIGFDHIYNQFFNRNVGGICFVSDGNYNKGNSPKYIAEKISLTPIFSVGVGDTTQKRDQLIRNVAANDIAFFKNKFPIEVDIEANKMGASSCELELYQNDKVIATEKLTYTNKDFDFRHVTFLVEANEIGFVNYTVKLRHLDNESSYENNERSVYIEVIDSRSKVLILSKAPHPDVPAIKSVIETDENLEVESMLISKWNGSFKDVELLILHGAGIGSNAELIRQANAINLPIFYFVTTTSSKNNVDNLNIGLSIPNDRRTDQVQGYLSEGFQLFELSDKAQKLLEKVPPIHVKFGDVKIDGGSTLISQRLGPVKKKDPILFFGKNTKSKFGVFVGEGLWKWKLSEYRVAKNNDGFNEIIQKSIQYLVVKKNSDPLRINLPKRFNINDEILINAEFYNSTLEQVTGPDINFNLVDEDDRKIPYVFAKNAKDYRLSLGKLKAGKYKWSADTKFDGKNYTKEGVFIVEDVSLETLSTSANHNLLKTIAANSNGKFYEIGSMNQLLIDIGNRNDIVNISYDETDYSDLIDWKWICFLVIVLLGTEWFIRRYSGSY
ncbi:MAG: hypothetical protein HRT57_04720 [Crocinitomicaceae bacterium]|nr:hypothetical protein [Crocinitomicaceae bacterium]